MRSLLPVALLLALSTCTEDSPTEPRFALAPSGARDVLSILSGNNQTGTAGAVLPAPLVVQLTHNGKAVKGASVTFSVTTGGGQVSPAAAMTDVQGRASASWTLGRVAGPGTAVASTKTASSITFLGTGVAGPPAQFTIVSGDKQSAVAGAQLANPLVVRVADANGNLVSGAQVQFAATTGGGSLGTPNAVSGANGQAQTTWTLGPTAGANAATATVGSLTPLPFAATGITGPPARFTIVSGNGQTAPVATLLPSPVVVRVADANDNPVSGATVTLTITAGGGSLDNASVPTDAAGRAQVHWTLGTLAGANALTAATSSLTALSLSAVGTAGAPAALALVSGNSQTGVAGTTLPQPLVVLVSDQYGNHVNNAGVTFAVTLGGGTLPPQATTDTSGRASATWTLGAAAGANGANAAVAGLPPISFSATATAGPPARLEVASGDGQSAFAGRTLPAPIVTRVADANGNPVANVAVGFAVTTGGGVLGSPNATTDANGHAATAWTLGATAGVNQATATVSGLTAVTFSATATEPPQVMLNVASGSSQSGIVGTPLRNPFVVLATGPSADPKMQGSPLAGVPVHFTVVQGGGSITSADAVTDAQGSASTVLTLGTTPGTNEVQVGAIGGTEPVSFFAFGSPPGPVSMTITSGDGQTALPGTMLAPLIVRVMDANNDGVGGVTVSFQVKLGGGTLSASSAMTDAQGIAQVSYTLGPAFGANVVDARIPGIPLVEFIEAAAPILQIVSGDNQTGIEGYPLPQPVVVRVAGANDAGIPGVPVGFSVTSGGGFVPIPGAVTDAAGLASATWILGPAQGTNTLRISALGAVVTVNATGIAVGPPASLTIASGNNQTGGAGFRLLQPITVQVSDANNLPVRTVAVAFTVTSGGGLVDQSTVSTDAGGRASTAWTLGATLGPNSLEASVTGLPPVTFTATAAEPIRIAAFDGQKQTGIVGTALPRPLIVLATHGQDGTPAEGMTLSFVITLGGGSLSTATAITDASGLGSVMLTLGPLPGENDVRVTAVGQESPLTFTATAAPAGPSGLVGVSGQYQAGIVGTTLGIPIAVRVGDAIGAPLAGVMVSFTADSKAGSVATPEVLTDADGLASTTWTLGDAGFPGVQAAVSGLPPVTFNAAAVPHLDLVAGGGQTGGIGAPLPQPIAVRATSLGGLPIPGLPVNLAVTSGGGAVSPAQGTTDAQGIAHATWTLGGTAGPNSMTAAFPNAGPFQTIAALSRVVVTANAVEAGPPTSLEAIAGDGQTGGANATLLAPAVVRVVDANGIGVSGVAVTFTAANGGATAPAVATTDVSGRAETQWTLGPGVGSQTLGAIVSGLPAVSFRATSIAPAALILRTPDGRVVTAGAPFNVEVQVVDASGNGMAGMPVTFSVVSGSGSVDPFVRTDAGGVAQTSVTALRTAGISVIQAEVPGLAPVRLTINVVAGAAANLSIVSGDKQSARYGTVLPQPVVARVADEFANPVAGAAVTFAVASGGGSVSAGDPVSDAAGLVSAVWTLGPAPGSNTLIASAPGLPSATFSATAEPGPAAVLRLVGGDQQQGNTQRELSEPLAVEVDDANGYAVAGQAVTFQVTSGGGSVAPVAAVTDGEGRATAIWTLGPSPGGQTVEAAAAGLAPVAFTAEAFGPTLTLVTANNQTVTVGSRLGVSVRAGDLQGRPLSGVLISFAVATGGGSVADASVATDAQGFATTTWTVGVAGPNRLSFTASGAPTFFVDATVTPGPPAQLVVVSGDGQSAQTGTTLRNPIVVQVLDVAGDRLPGISVQFTATDNGSVYLSPAATDANGQVSVVWTLGPGVPGSRLLQVTVSGVSTGAVGATATAISGPVVTMASGNNQVALAGSQLPQPIAVRAIGADGSPIAGLAVSFEVVQGGGHVFAGTAVTDTSGVASTPWVLGSASGNNTVRATAQSGTVLIYFNAFGN